VIRCILLSLSLLAALTFLPGTPAHSLTGVETMSANGPTAAGNAFTGKRSFREDGDLGGLDGWADEQEEDVRIVRAGSAIRWPVIEAGTLVPRDRQTIARRHPACASPPRGPPTLA
jgi:hypothetical protein